LQLSTLDFIHEGALTSRSDRGHDVTIIDHSNDPTSTALIEAIGNHPGKRTK